MTLEKTNVPGYMKSKKMNCVINTNLKEYKAFQAEKKRILKIKNLEEEIREMRTLLKVIKDSL